MNTSTSSSKAIFRTFCEKEKMSLFMQPWWLDAISSSRWDVVLDKRDNQIMGGWVFQESYKMGFTYLVNSSLSPHQGIFFNYPSDLGRKRKLSFENEVLQNLCKKLPKVRYVRQQLHPNIRNVLPLYWKGFSLHLRYTYRLNLLCDLDQIWENLHTQARRMIAKVESENLFEIEEIKDPEIVYRLHAKSMDKQGKKPQFSLCKFKQLDTELEKRKLRKIWAAKGRDGSVIGAVHIVWFDDTAYYLLGGVDTSKKIAGITTCLLWKAIKDVSTRVRVFDFEGSMIPQVELLFRSFGAEQKTYLEIEKYRFPLNLMKVFR